VGQMEISNLYGEVTSPYYIYTPRYIESSAGIKALHFLCHSLNRAGQKAFLVFSEPKFADEPRVNPFLLTPVLTEEIALSHFRAKLNPITIYSETVPGNPLGATAVVRYLLNYVGALGGPNEFEEHELIVSFSKNISDNYFEISDTCSPVLFLPPIDPREFQKSTEKSEYQIVYAGKYRSFVGWPPKVGTLPTIEIFRDGPRMQTRSQVKALIQSAQVVASFENSSILIEAILCGTPAIFIDNQFLGKPIAEKELGNYGIAIDFSENSLEFARATNDKAITNYFECIQQYFSALDEFITVSQQKAKSEGYNYQVSIPSFGSSVVSSHRLGLARQVLKTKGLFALMRVVFHFFARRVSWRAELRNSKKSISSREA